MGFGGEGLQINPFFRGIIEGANSLFDLWNQGPVQPPGVVQGGTVPVLPTINVQATPCTTQAGMLTGPLAVMRAALAPILAKASAFLGMRAVSVPKVYRTFRRLAQVLGPTAAAAALGLTAAEVAQIMTYQSLKKRKRTNYLNMRALGRAQRRMCGFQRTIERNYSIQKSMPRRKRRTRTCRK